MYTEKYRYKFINKLNKKRQHPKDTIYLQVDYNSFGCKVQGGYKMDMYVFMGICEELKLEGKDLSKFKLKDIKKIYKNYIR